jgi:FkbM family methyltransferase
MIDFKIVSSRLRDIGLIKETSETNSMSLGALRNRVEGLERQIQALTVAIEDTMRGQLSQLSLNLDIAINEIEFVRRRANAFLGEGAMLTYLTDESPIFVDPRDSGPAANILNGGVYEQNNVDTLMSFVRPNTVFLDLGANVGIFSLLVGRRVVGRGKVYAFEPQAHLTKLLRRSAFLNGLGSLSGVGTIESHEFAVSDRNGKVGFTVPEGHLGGGHISEGGAGQSVAVVRLDDFLGADFRCDLVKIDVEGHELPALVGMEKILASSGQVKVLFEKLGRDQGNEKDVERFFGELNFNIYGIADQATLTPLEKGDLAQWDGYALAGKVGDPDLIELNRRRFFIYPDQLALRAAAIENGAVKSESAMGEIIFHGPYWFLPRGQYHLRLHGELKGGLTITIATRYGYPLATCQFAPGALSSDFTIERDAVLFECVARSQTADTQLSLQRIEIVYR